MATELRTQPLQFDLARLEQDPKAIHSYHREIQRRIAYLLPPLEETLRITDGAWLEARLSERASALGIATLRPDSLLLLARLFRERKGWRWLTISLVRTRQRCAHGKNRRFCQRAHRFRKRSPCW